MTSAALIVLAKGLGFFAYMLVEKYLGKTEHGSVLDLVKNIFSNILNKNSKTGG